MTCNQKKYLGYDYPDYFLYLCPQITVGIWGQKNRWRLLPPTSPSDGKAEGMNVARAILLLNYPSCTRTWQRSYELASDSHVCRLRSPIAAEGGADPRTKIQVRGQRRMLLGNAAYSLVGYGCSRRCKITRICLRNDRRTLFASSAGNSSSKLLKRALSP